MAWDLDTPFPAPSTLGETPAGCRNLAPFVESLLVDGPVLILGACEAAVRIAAYRETVVIDWNLRRLSELREYAASRGIRLRTLGCDPERQSLGLDARSVSNVVCLDVLERLRDDVTVLDKLHRVLAVDGQLIVRVSACPWMTSREGALPASRRFYDPEGLRDALEDAAFRVRRLRHWNAIGLPEAFVRERFLGRSPVDLCGIPTSEQPRKFWDKPLDFWLRHIESHLGFPVGASLIAIATPHLCRDRVKRPAAARGMSGRRVRAAYEPMGLSR